MPPGPKVDLYAAIRRELVSVVVFRQGRAPGVRPRLDPADPATLFISITRRSAFGEDSEAETLGEVPVADDLSGD
jgi:hypothetical protein